LHCSKEKKLKEWYVFSTQRSSMEKKEIIFLSIIMMVVFIGQLSIADRVLFGDDYIFAGLAEENDFFFRENAHPPLPVWSDIFLTEILPLTNRTMRLTSIIFATLTIALVYFLAKNIVGQRSAWIAALLVGLSAWHIRASQMNSGSDGGMLTFFFYLTIYFFVQYVETQKTKEIISAGVAFGLTMLSKETSVLLIPTLGFYYVYVLWKTEKSQQKEECKKAIKNSIGIVLIAGIVWSIFPLLDFIHNNGQSVNAILERANSAVSEGAAGYSYWFMTAFSTFKLLLWSGPLLFFLPIVCMVKKKEWKHEWIFIFLIIVSVLFYFIITPPNLDRTRYLMITIPALAILCAKYITQHTEEWKKREWFLVGVLSIGVFIIFFIINQHAVVVSYESEQNPIALIKQGNLNFSIPVFTETDNSGFLLHFWIFVAVYGITGLACVFLFAKNKMLGKIALIIFLSVSSGYNFIVAEAYGLHWSSPNYSEGIKEIIVYAQENDLQEPLYLLKNYELQWYLRDKYENFVSDYGISETDAVKIEDLKQELEQHGGTIIFTDMPPMDKEGLLSQMIHEQCVAEYAVVDKGIEIGLVLSC